MKRHLASFIAAALCACGPKPTPAPIATLPGDGDANVAKPATPATPAVVDAWSGKTDLVAPPAVKPPAAVELPQIDTFKLANGLPVYVIKSSRMRDFEAIARAALTQRGLGA